MRSRNDDADHDTNANPTRQNDTCAARDGVMVTAGVRRAFCA